MADRPVTLDCALQDLARDLVETRLELAAAQRQVSALGADRDRLTRRLGYGTEQRQTQSAQRHLVAAIQDATAGLDQAGVPLGPLVHRFATAVGGQFAVVLDVAGRCVIATDMTGSGAAGQVVSRVTAGVARAMLIEGSPEIEAVLAAPMWAADERRVGTLAATCATPTASETNDLIELTRSFAALAALVVAQHHHPDPRRHFARRDAVTGCLQRGDLDRALARELSISARTGRAHAICFLDLDDFKSVNETGGHLAGDRVLATVGEALRGHARDYDHVGRYGGDEFVIVMPDTNRSDAERGSQHLIAAIETATDRVGQPISASVGVSSWSAGQSSQDMLQTADEEMQTAKAARRRSFRQRRRARPARSRRRPSVARGERDAP